MRKMLLYGLVVVTPMVAQKTVSTQQAQADLPGLNVLQGMLTTGAMKARQAYRALATHKEQVQAFEKQLESARVKLGNARRGLAGRSNIPSSIQKPLQRIIKNQEELIVVLTRMLDNGREIIAHLEAKLPVVASKARGLAGNVQKLYTQGHALFAQGTGV